MFTTFQILYEELITIQNALQMFIFPYRWGNWDRAKLNGLVKVMQGFETAGSRNSVSWAIVWDVATPFGQNKSKRWSDEDDLRRESVTQQLSPDWVYNQESIKEGTSWYQGSTEELIPRALHSTRKRIITSQIFLDKSSHPVLPL